LRQARHKKSLTLSHKKFCFYLFFRAQLFRASSATMRDVVQFYKKYVWVVFSPSNERHKSTVVKKHYSKDLNRFFFLIDCFTEKSNFCFYIELHWVSGIWIILTLLLWFDFRLELIFTNVTAASKKRGLIQKWSKLT